MKHTNEKRVKDKCDRYPMELIDAMTHERLHPKERFWQIVTCVTCFIAYVFVYFCRNQLYVVNTNFKSYLASDNKEAQKYLGIMLAFGYAAYLCGKILFSFITDTYLKSGVIALMITMIFAPISSLLFALISINNNQSLRIVVVMVLWSVLRIAQASGWIGIVKIISNWIPYKYHGRVMSFVSVSFLLGDFVTRIILGAVLTYSEKWQHIFIFAAIATGSFAIPTVILLRDDPTKRGLPKQSENPENVYSKNNTLYRKSYDSNGAAAITNNTTWGILKPLLGSFDFWLVLIYSFEFSLIREMFNVYSAMYLHESVGASTSVSAWISALFPLMGVFSAPLCGLWLDKISKKHLRFIILPIAAFIICICLLVFTIFNDSLSIELVSFLLLFCGFSLLGPYSLLAGVMSIDLGGQTSPALICGLVDASGYIGAILLSLISAFFDFQVMFAVAAFIAFLAVVTGIVQFTRNYKLALKQDEKRNLI